MRMAWVIILFLVSSTVAQTSITFGGYLQDLGNFLTTSYTTDTNTFLAGVIAGGLVLLQAPLIVIYKIIAEVISIVALSLFINFLGERMGFGSFIPFIRDALPRDDSSIFDSPYDILPSDETADVRSYVDKKYLVSVYPEGHEIKTVRTFQKPGKGVESNQFVDGRRNHRKMNPRRRNNYVGWRRGRSNSEFNKEEISNLSLKSYINTRNLSAVNRQFILKANDRANSFENKKEFSKGILNYISDIGNEFLKNRVNNLANKVLESDRVKSFKNSLTKNISNFVFKSILGS